MRRAVHPVMRHYDPPPLRGSCIVIICILDGRGRRDPAIAVVIIVDDDGNNGDKRIINAEQRGRMTKDVVSPTPLSAAQFVSRHFHHRVIINIFAAGRHPLSPTFASHCPIHPLCHSH